MIAIIIITHIVDEGVTFNLFYTRRAVPVTPPKAARGKAAPAKPPSKPVAKKPEAKGDTGRTPSPERTHINLHIIFSCFITAVAVTDPPVLFVTAHTNFNELVRGNPNAVRACPAQRIDGIDGDEFIFMGLRAALHDR